MQGLPIGTVDTSWKSSIIDPPKWAGLDDERTAKLRSAMAAAETLLRKHQARGDLPKAGTAIMRCVSGTGMDFCICTRWNADGSLVMEEVPLPTGALPSK